MQGQPRPFDALQPQTILAYGMHGGAPLRLRVVRKPGDKAWKYRARIEVVDRVDGTAHGRGDMVAGLGFSW